MSDATTALRKASVERVLRGDATTSRESRAAAFANADVTPPAMAALVDKVAHDAWNVTDEDVAAAKRAGLSDDAIFELAIAAAMGQATRQLEAALDVVDVACKESP